MNDPVIRCMSCNTPIGDKWDAFFEKRDQLRSQGVETLPYLTKDQKVSPIGKVLTELGVVRICCRKHFLVHA